MKKIWTKRDPIKNYFPLPNEIYQLGLSSGAIAVYGYLLRIEDRATFQCYPSYGTIGGDEQEHSSKICGRAGGAEAHPNGTDLHHHSGWA
mgnify:CR=1 FL=1